MNGKYVLTIHTIGASTLGFMSVLGKMSSAVATSVDQATRKALCSTRM